MVHDILGKIDLVLCSKEVQHQLVINTWLIRASSLLKEAFCYEFQKHPVLAINIHQLCWGVSFQYHSLVAIQKRMISVGVLDEPASCSDPACFSNHFLCDCYGDAHHRWSDLCLSEGFQTHLLPSLSAKTWVFDHSSEFFVLCSIHIIHFCPYLEVFHERYKCWSIQHFKIWKHLLCSYKSVHFHPVPIKGCEVHRRFTLDFEWFKRNGHCLRLYL